MSKWIAVNNEKIHMILPGVYLVKGDDTPDYMKTAHHDHRPIVRVAKRINGSVGAQVTELFWQCMVTGQQIYPTHFQMLDMEGVIVASRQDTAICKDDNLAPSCPYKEIDYRVSECLRRMNLDRPDIAELENGALIVGKIEDVRYYAKTILILHESLKTAVELINQEDID